MFKKIFTLLFILVGSQVNAGVINNLTNVSGSNIVSDSLNNVEYLRFDTLGLMGNLASVNSLMSNSSSALYGFHIASADENVAFMNAAFGITVNPTVRNEYHRANNIGFTSVMGDGYLLNGNNIWLHELDERVSGPNLLSYSFTSEIENNNQYMYSNQWSGSDSVWGDNMAFLAVRNASAQVPEPGALSLLGLGLAGLGFARKQKRS